MTTRSAARDEIRRLCAGGGPERTLRAAALRILRAVVPFDYYVWVLTDPVTAVGAAPLAEIPSLTDVADVVRAKYLTAANRWTGLALGEVATLATTGATPWRDMLAGQGVADVAAAALRDRFGLWGFLDLWRCGQPFANAETEFLASVLPELTTAIRCGVASTFVPAPQPTTSSPVVLVLSERLVPREQTPQTEAQLRALLPTPPHQAPVPAVAINVAAQLLAVEAGIDDHPASARLAYGPGRWITVRAARLGASSIAVTMERSTTAERVEVYTHALGLTARETQLVGVLVTGADTRGAARALGISEHTVNDHLKSIFAKAGTASRRRLIANATG